MILLGLNYLAQAQQQYMFTQYMFNGLAINPAYAGTDQGVSLTALGREQWLGLDGAPSTQTFSVHSPLYRREVGLGLLVSRDKIGPTQQYGVYASYAYKMELNRNTKLSLGLQAGFNQYNSDLSGLNVVTPLNQIDPIFNQNISEFLPNFGVGLYLYTRNSYLGISAPQLLTGKLGTGIPANGIVHPVAKQSRHYFLTGGYVFDLNRDLKLKPNILVKVVEGAPIEADLNANLYIKDVIGLGLSYRSFDSFDAIFELILNNKFRIGYSYDFATTTNLNQVQTGSHELMLNYRIQISKEMVLTPRYF